MRPVLAVLAVLLAVALAGCGGARGDAGPPPARVALAPPCRPVRSPAPRRVRLAPRGAPGRHVTALMRTSCGTVVVALAARRQPRTVASFVALARAGGYDATTFFRVSRRFGGGEFVVVGGPPRATGPAVVEAPSQDARYTRGTVAMLHGRAEPPGSSRAAFFVVTAPDAELPPDFAILGHVIAGRGVLARIAATPSRPPTEAPAFPIVIERIEVRAR